MLRFSYIKMLKKYMKGKITEDEINFSYLNISKAEEDGITYYEFQQAFKVDNPA